MGKDRDDSPFGFWMTGEFYLVASDRQEMKDLLMELGARSVKPLKVKHSGTSKIMYTKPDDERETADRIDEFLGRVLE